VSKLPWFKFDPMAWLSDGKLSICSPASRGIWIDLICHMHDRDRCGELSGTPSDLAKLCRCTPAQLRSALEEYSRSNCADVTACNGNVTIVNRRMKREFQHRNAGYERVKRFRNGESASLLCTLTSNLLHLFELFWKNYPRKVGKGKCVEWFSKHEPDAELVNRMVAAIAEQKRWPQWSKDGGQFIPHPITWLNQGRWEDEGATVAGRKSVEERLAEVGGAE
jgi:hypothetical protein